MASAFLIEWMTGRLLEALFAVLALVIESSGVGAAEQSDARVSAVQPVTFPSDGPALRGVLARPPGEGPFPGSMTFEAAARPPWTRLEADSQLDRLARPGYVVLLVARRGHRGSEGAARTHTIRNSSFEDNGHYLFTRQTGYPLFMPDRLRFLDLNLKGVPAR